MELVIQREGLDFHLPNYSGYEPSRISMCPIQTQWIVPFIIAGVGHGLYNTDIWNTL